MVRSVVSPPLGAARSGLPDVAGGVAPASGGLVVRAGRSRHDRVHRDVQAGGVGEVAAGEGEDRVRHVLGQHLALSSVRWA